jgi:peptidoglycan-associated lipoprotein
LLQDGQFIFAFAALVASSEGGNTMQSSTGRRFALLFLLLGMVYSVAGCKKKVAAPPPAQAPAPVAAQPTVTLNASPSSIQSGGTITLTWSSTNATDLDLQPGIGKVAPQGKTSTTATNSTTYTITATGPGGTATATASVSVEAAEAPAPAPAQPGIAELFSQNVKDAYYDFNKSDVRADARDALTKDAEFLRSYPQVRVTIEGYCDERGSTEYNLGLGERRAQAAKNYLISLGISADRMDTVSWGKERPFCTEHTEACWQQNRRAHFVMAH